MRTPLILVAAVAVVAAVVVALSGVGSGPSPTPSGVTSTSSGLSASPVGARTVLWPAPSNPLERTVDAGLEPAPKEYLVNHVHAHLDVFIDGQAIVVPAGIGINIADPKVRRFDNPIGYGGIEMCDQPCISPLHTHDETGVIHTESADPQPHTLGQFFVEWDVELSSTCVGEHCAPTPIAIYVDGSRYGGDPRAIELTDRKVIVIVVGTPPEVIPSTYDFSNA